MRPYILFGWLFSRMTGNIHFGNLSIEGFSSCDSCFWGWQMGRGTQDCLGCLWLAKTRIRWYLWGEGSRLMENLLNFYFKRILITFHPFVNHQCKTSRQSIRWPNNGQRDCCKIRRSWTPASRKTGLSAPLSSISSISLLSYISPTGSSMPGFFTSTHSLGAGQGEPPWWWCFFKMSWQGFDNPNTMWELSWTCQDS